MEAHKFHLFKMVQVQELNKHDPDPRVCRFCEVFNQQLIDKQNFLYNIFFPKETLITVDIGALPIPIASGKPTHSTFKIC